MNVRSALCAIAVSLLAAGSPRAQDAGLLLEPNLPVPMRDGLMLRADVMRPKTIGAVFPVLVYRTPYGKDAARAEYKIFDKAVARGYAVVIQDVRGRYASEGEFRPYENEGRDGFDTIEWAARQPWSNGSIGTFGLSYPGAVQWLAALQSPPHLKAMVPAMTFSSAQNFFFAGGTWDMSWIDWIWFNIAPDVRAKRNLEGPKTLEQAAAAWDSEAPAMRGYLPLARMPQLRDTAPYYYDWLGHPAQDPWWDWAELRDKYDRNHAAVLNLSGWYDDNYGPEGATTNFLGTQKSRAHQPRKDNALLIGPWVHGVDSTRQLKSGEREFPAIAAIDYDEVVLSWMDYHLRGIANRVATDKPVRYFVMGADEWREAQSWPPASRPATMYLTAGADGRSGVLASAKPRSRTGFSSFVSDPANPVVNEYASAGAHDYRKLADRTDVLTFDSEPLDRDTEVTGPIRAQVFVSCDCRDLDLWVRVLDRAADGTVFNLMSPGLDVQRASYRDLTRGRQWLQPGQIYPIELNNLISSNTFLKGHRIRVQISASFHPNFSRNLQSGESEVLSAQLHKATIKVHTDAQHASRVILPVIRR